MSYDCDRFCHLLDAKSCPFRDKRALMTISPQKLHIQSDWQVVGHRHQLADPGDFFTRELQGESLLLVRGASGELRGFYNVCRHRAGPPAEGCGSRKLLRCGYYGLDGSVSPKPSKPLQAREGNAGASNAQHCSFRDSRSLPSIGVRIILWQYCYNIAMIIRENAFAPMSEFGLRTECLALYSSFFSGRWRLITL